MQAALYCFLECLGYKVLPEFSVSNGSSRAQSVDLLVLDQAYSPIAAIELKSYSIHQSGGAGRLLTSPPPTAKGRFAPSIDEDYRKRHGNTFPWLSSLVAPTSHPSTSIPLIQIGLLTAVQNPSGSLSHPARALRTWASRPVPGGWRTAAQLGINNWWSTASGRYSAGCHGWGPQQTYSIPPGIRNSHFPVEGHVAYVCVMT